MYQIYVRKPLVGEGIQYFPYMSIPGVEGIPEKLLTLDGQEVSRAFHGKIKATGQLVSPGDYLIKDNQGNLHRVPYDVFQNEWEEFKDNEGVPNPAK